MAGHPGEEGIRDPGKEARARIGIPVVPAFDGYRAFAILAVVMLHVTTISGVAAVGDTGVVARLVWGSLGHAVEILFLVSGFVVFLPTVARGGSFGDLPSFAIRRLARLFPAYWMVLLLTVILIAILHPAFSKVPGPDDLLVNFTGSMVPVGFFVRDIPVGFGLNQPLWTLSVELGFYIVLPLIAGAFFRRPWLGLAISAAITIAWTIAFDHVGELTDLLGIPTDFDELIHLRLTSAVQLPAWAYSFGLGMAGAWAWVRLAERGVPRAWVRRTVLASGLALLALVWVLGGFYDQTRESLLLSVLFSSVLAVFMVSLTFAPARWQVPVAAAPVRRLGDISYGIYLSHMVIAVTLSSETSLPKDGNLKSLLVWIAAVVPAAALYGYLSARFLEQPIRRWARRYGRRDEA